MYRINSTFETVDCSRFIGIISWLLSLDLSIGKLIVYQNQQDESISPAPPN